MQKLVGILTVVLAFIIPLLILIYCYGRILWALTKRLDSKLNSPGSQSDVFEVARRNTLKTFLIVGICFIVCWSNNQIYFLLDYLGFPADWNSTYYKFTTLMVFSNCTVNPFVYLVSYRDYQTALRLCFGCKAKCSSTTGGGNTHKSSIG